LIDLSWNIDMYPAYTLRVYHQLLHHGLELHVYNVNFWFSSICVFFVHMHIQIKLSLLCKECRDPFDCCELTAVAGYRSWIWYRITWLQCTHICGFAKVLVSVIL
jgi:hypothetical protein